MNASQFDVFHDRRHESVGTISQRVGFSLDGVVEESVNQDGPLGVTSTAAATYCRSMSSS